MGSSEGSLTEGRRIYAIGDIHGHLDLLDVLLERIRADLRHRPHPNPVIVFLGDYGDRGPDSRGVHERLIELGSGPIPVRTLLGNHDNYLIAYLEDPAWFDRPMHWLHPAMGGAETLASYGVPNASDARPEAAHAAFARAVPKKTLDFLNRCELVFRIGGYVFVHAGVRPGVPIEAQDREDSIWIREPFLSHRGDLGFKVVHGHTIVPEPEHHLNRIAIDTGAFRTGRLTCLVLEDDDVSLLEPTGLKAFPLGSGLPQGIGSRLRNLVRRA